jgi:type IV pilus assembly protein PilV
MIRRRQRGVSMIEVLVTMLLLMFGLLGVAGLMVKGVSNAAASESTTKANQLLADMADRIRANPAVALSATSEYITAYGSTIPSTPTSIAQQDKKDWLTAVRAQLPLGDGKITTYVSGGGRKLELQVRWAKCLGSLSDADQVSCADASESTYQTVTMELRL